MLVDPKRLDLRFQHSSGHTQSGGGTRRSGHPSAALPQGRLNDLFLLGSKSLRQIQRVPGLAWAGLPRKPTLVDRENLCVTYNDGALDYVLQFTNIAWPGVRLKQFEALFVHRPETFSSLPGETIDEIFNEQ